MKKYLLLLVSVFLISASCYAGKKYKIRYNSILKYPPIEFLDSIHVLQPSDVVTKDAIKIGEIDLRDTFFTKTSYCTYHKGVEILKNHAQKNGANIIHINVIISPNFASSCYQFTATFYRLE